MTLYYHFPMNPFCHLCLYTMMVHRDPDVRDEHGIIKTIAWCTNGECPQRGKRFEVPPLTVEVKEEVA